MTRWRSKIDRHRECVAVITHARPLPGWNSTADRHADVLIIGLPGFRWRNFVFRLFHVSQITPTATASLQSIAKSWNRPARIFGASPDRYQRWMNEPRWCKAWKSDGDDAWPRRQAHYVGKSFEGWLKARRDFQRPRRVTAADNSYLLLGLERPPTTVPRGRLTNRFLASFIGADSDDVFHRRDENLSVTDLSRLRWFENRLNDFRG